MDEFAKQLLSEKRAPFAAIPGRLDREDNEYLREGSVSGFMIAMPDLGKRDVCGGVDGCRPSLDFAAYLDHLANTLLPEAAKIVLVMDNLDTHEKASLYEAFAPDKARTLCERLEMHWTPKHGSWLNTAEIEIGLLGRIRSDRRIGSVMEFKNEVRACLTRKNAESKSIDWQFTNEKARIKLK